MLLTAFCRQVALRLPNRPRIRPRLIISILRIMQLTGIFILACSLTLSARSVSQTVTFTGSNVPMEKVLREVKRQTGFSVVANREQIRTSQPVSVRAENMPLKDFLSMVFSDQPFEYIIEGNSIAIRKKIIIEENTGTNAPPIKISGTVLGLNNQPLAGATVRVKGKNITAVTDDKGYFELETETGSTIVVSYVGFEATEIKVRNADALRIGLIQSVSTLDTLEVSLNTGYQRLPKERVTGSFAFVDNTLLNRRVSTDVVSRLEGVVPGLLFNRNTFSGANGKTDISIRGRNTLFANTQPLIIVDNFPYDGDINHINPNDVENITVLKDAAAASIWGARSGNGVIVITTKRGKRNQQPSVGLNTNVSFGERPDQYYSRSFIRATDFIDIEKKLFGMGFYDADLVNLNTSVSPVVEILSDYRNNLIDSATAYSSIDALGNNDIRQDISKYLYRNSLMQQYALNIRGGGLNSDYYFSMGYDNNLSSLRGNKDKRITLNGVYNFDLSKKLRLSTGVTLIKSLGDQNGQGNINTSGKGNLYPYAQLVGPDGKALPVPTQLQQRYLDTAGGGKLKDWKYRPVDELRYADNGATGLENRINLGLSYTVFDGLSIDLKYQYLNATQTGENYFSDSTYEARNLINRFAQIETGDVTYPVPLGGILRQSENELTSNRGRAQLNFNKSWKQLHSVALIVGSEISSTVSNSQSATLYGFDKSRGSFQTINPLQTFPLRPTGSGRIPFDQAIGKTTDRFLSYFSNASYTFNRLYTVSASGRMDKSNLFGVNTNDQSVPLYSLGASWDIGNAAFYHFKAIPVLKLRTTFGYNGNVDNRLTAVTTLRESSNSPYSGLPYYTIANPGNPQLRWEKIRLLNMGLDFATARNRISGSLEYFIKAGLDLFGDAALPGSSGRQSFRGNTANTKGHGFDIVLNSVNITGKKLTWSTTLQISSAFDKVTKYQKEAERDAYFYDGNTTSVVPIVGRPLAAIYSYKWGGLDNSGDPLGYVNGKSSKDWVDIIQNTPADSLIYNGPSRPTTFGALRNTFTYKGFSLSVNILFKMGYYFRRTSISYAGLYSSWSMHSDFYKRWQQPGDERMTSVPAMVDPLVPAGRETFYASSETLVSKGDHIRLQDIQLSYSFNDIIKKGVMTNLEVYGYVNNLGILWRANDDGLDPDVYSSAYPLPKIFSFGVRANF